MFKIQVPKSITQTELHRFFHFFSFLQEYLDIIRREYRRCSCIVQSLLTFSPRKAAELSRINLEPLIRNICLPALRHHMEDMPALIEYFLGRLRPGERTPRIIDRAMQCLMAYNWPGNIRELQNVLERALILSEGDLITEQSLPLELAGRVSPSTPNAPFPPLKEVKRQHILAVMQFAGGSRTRAAEILGIGRKTLYRKLQALAEC